ncbi:MAG: sigma-70 family RNA polymerase sigma factor [Clostridia bacterium]|nr:sigma-70 family RNA polymerase sigma factor [Clostridia bacterium]
MNELKQLEDYLVDDEIDIDKIIDDFTPYITSIINRETNQMLSFEDKEEIFSDTFFLLWKNRNRLTIQVSLKSYLAGITRNLMKEKYRKLKINYDFADFENEVDDTFSFYENDREQILDIEQKLKGLKPIDIDIVNLYYYSSKSMKDIAKILNISELNVKTRLHRVRKKIKKELDMGGM